MAQSLKWKMLLILVLVGFLVAIVSVGIFAKNSKGLLASFQGERVQLRAKILQEDMVSNHLQDLGNEVLNLLSDRQQGAIVSSGVTLKDGQITIGLVKPEDAQKVKARLEKLLQPVASSIESMKQEEIVELDLSQPDDKSIVLKFTQDGIAERSFATVAEAVDVLKRRYDDFGYTNVSIQHSGADEFEILVPTDLEIDEVKQIATVRGKMGFHLVDNSMMAKDVGANKPPIGTRVIDTWDPSSGERKVLIKIRAVFTEKDLLDASANFDQRTNEPIVTFRFSKQATKRFCRFSERNVGHRFAIVMDDVSITAPVIRDAICGGFGQISGNFTTQQAESLAVWMRTGALPVNLVFIDEKSNADKRTNN